MTMSLRVCAGLLSMVCLLFAWSARATPSNAFDAELHMVDPQARFVRSIDSSYGRDEWSVDGLHLRGGSEDALDSAASEALHAMGFRFYTPRHARRPATLLPVSIPKRRLRIPDLMIFLAYGHDRNSDIGKRLGREYSRWQTLNNVGSRRWPAGHTWQRIIAKRSEYKSDASLLRDPRTFELDEPEAYAKNVQICAEYIRENLTEHGTHSFDPSDGDKYPSTTIYKFALDVINEVRRTRPHAKIGVYAYAEHRLPVDFKLPGIYIQVALAYNRTHLSYEQLIAAHARVADHIMLREYFDVQAWFHSYPAGNPRNQRDYYAKNYPAYLASDIIAVTGEFQENWLANVVAINHAIRYLKTGESDFEAVLDDVVAGMFDGDPAVREAYWLWSTPGMTFDKAVARKSLEIVARMRPGWYAEVFKKYLVISIKTLELGSKNNPLNFSYERKLEDLLSNVEAWKGAGYIHAYAFKRRLANGNVRFDYPDLWMMKSPPPAWMADPKEPTVAEFDEFHRRYVGAAP